MAVKLKWYFEQIDWKRIIDTAYTNDERYRYLRKETLDVVFACIVGNGYGCAGSVKYFVSKVINGSFLARIKI